MNHNFENLGHKLSMISCTLGHKLLHRFRAPPTSFFAGHNCNLFTLLHLRIYTFFLARPVTNYLQLETCNSFISVQSVASSL